MASKHPTNRDLLDLQANCGIKKLAEELQTTENSLRSHIWRVQKKLDSYKNPKRDSHLIQALLEQPFSVLGKRKSAEPVDGAPRKAVKLQEKWAVQDVIVSSLKC